MYFVFLDELSGRTFVDDLDIIQSKIEILNSKTMETGRLYEDEYFKEMGLMTLNGTVTYVSDGIPPILKLRITNMKGVPTIVIYLDSYKCIVLNKKEA